MSRTGPAGYVPMPAQVDLPAMERAMLARWHERDTFARSVAQSSAGAPWTFFDGPMTANGRPGAHHLEARVFKDVFPRFHTMRGRYVVRKAGWDCHGLPVELAVERELGLRGKADIEAYGVAEFNAHCRESVERHVGAFEEFTERLGYWIDTSDAYRTMDISYVESVWWSLKQIFAAGLLVEDYRSTPYCPRCGTGLSDHELGQEGGYETVADPSVFVRLPLTSGPLAGEAALLVWTTTPWTLVSNTAVAVHPTVDYVAASDGSETLVVAEPLLAGALGEGWRVTRRFVGRELERWRYHPPFELVDVPDAHYVVVDGYVSTEDGTGLVHQSPAFGEEDLRVSRAYGLPVVNPVGLDGRFESTVPLIGGEFFKHADAALLADLDARGRLFRRAVLEHAYPHCWRCHTPLLYYALPSWYVRTTAAREALLRENERTAWYPAGVKWGRYGDWLRNNVDWALSRRRYWGTPLPIWRCPQGHLTCVGSRAELAEYAGRDLSDLDPHRPNVDEVTLPCPQPSRPAGPECGEEARRVPEVIDAWYDSGSMPFAQWGYPHLPGSAERFTPAYPAQFIAEGIDQTRGWFYTLMAVGTLVFDRSAYENVVCLGHIVAEDGRKMSKHLGNVLEPMPLMERHGADAVRWFMAASGSPWQQRRIGHGPLQEVVRKVLLTYWNTASFLTLYADANGWSPAVGSAAAPAERSVLDRWALSELHRLVSEVTDAYEDFDTQRVGRLLSTYVDDLSNWYVRRSRRRFWDGDTGALATLHECLRVLTLTMAPLVPFVTERVWQDVVVAVEPDAPESVHLAPWPQPQADLVLDDLGEQMASARRLVELGRAARAEANVRTRQPLRRALVASNAWSRLSEPLRREVADELNVGSLEPLAGVGDDLVAHTVKANFRALGRRFGSRTPQVAAALAAADAARVAQELRARGRVDLSVDGTDVELTPEDVIVAERPRSGWSVVNEQGETVALDLELTGDLRAAGVAREVVRLVQDARRAAGLEVTDRIALWWTAGPDDVGSRTAEALRAHADLVAGEVLATAVREGTPPADLPQQRADELGLSFWLTRADG